MLKTDAPVWIFKMKEYDKERLVFALSEAIAGLGADGLFRGKAVVVKPNLVREMDPETGGTTHPVMLEALGETLKKLGAGKMILAESPAGFYSEAHLMKVYDACGMTEACRRAGIELNFDLGYGVMKAPEGKKSKTFEVIDPIRNADVVVNLSKMKSHGMLTQSCAAKNLFGVIPGVKKFEMHARFPDAKEFAGMLCDLNEMLDAGKTVLHICDGIVGMEGNGPTNGTPVKIGAVLLSFNPFCVDRAAACMMGMEDRPELLGEGIARGYCPEKTGELNCPALRPEDCTVSSFRLPDSAHSSTLNKFLTLGGGKYAKFFEPRPVINKKTCRGCGVCARSCPQKTIGMTTLKKGKKVAHVDKKNCIKCYCCQEVCPFDSVKIKRSLLLRMVK